MLRHGNRYKGACDRCWDMVTGAGYRYWVLRYKVTGTGYWVLWYKVTGTGYWVLWYKITDTEYWVLRYKITDTEYWVLWYKITDTGYWVLWYNVSMIFMQYLVHGPFMHYNIHPENGFMTKTLNLKKDINTKK
jgi:hypothetical protein